MDGKRRLILGEGFASRVSGNVRPQDPGAGAMPIVAPRRMMNDDVSDTPELSRGGGGSAQLVPSRISVVLVEETNAGDTPGRECPCEDQEKRPLAGTRKSSSGTMSDDDIRSICGGGGRCPLPLLPGGGGSFRLMLHIHQRCLLRDLGRFPRRFRWCSSMGPWLGTLQDGSVYVRIEMDDRRLA